MTSREANSDPRPLLAIFVALVALAIWRAISNIDTEAALELAERVAPLALGVVAIASALATQRLDTEPARRGRPGGGGRGRTRART